MGRVSFYCMCFLAATAFLNATSNCHPITAERCIELKRALSPIIQHANKTHPQSFHVPVDVKHNCLESALGCFRKQIYMLQEATETNNESAEKVSFEKLLKKVKLKRSSDEKDCTPCFNYSTTKPSEFLEKMDTLLQRITFEKKSQ